LYLARRERIVGYRIPTLPGPPSLFNTWFVHPTGSSTNTGVSTAQAWDLSTALSGGSTGHKVKPGDTVLLLSGTYGDGTQTFTAGLLGSPTNPIVVTAPVGQHAAINCVELEFSGSYTWIMSDPSTATWVEIFRSTTTSPDGTDLIRIAENDNGIKLIHVVVHDGLGVGISPQSEVSDTEIYGCYVYNNGRSSLLAPTYGHGIYAHGDSTPGHVRRIRNNILFDQVGYGMHCFADTGNLQNFDIENNICFGNGLGNGFDFLVGGVTDLINLTCSLNYAIRNDGNPVATIGYFAGEGGTNRSGSVLNNYFAGTVNLDDWDIGQLTFQGNTCVGSGNQVIRLLFSSSTATFGGFKWNNNTYASNQSTFGIMAIDVNGGGSETTYDTLAQWRTATGFDANSTYTQTANGTLGGTQSLTKSIYNGKVGHLVIHNPTSAATVNVDISHIVTNGNTYAILSVYDLFGTPVLSGTYTGGTVAVPLTGTGKTPPPVTGGGFTPTNNLPEIGVYVVIQTN